MSDNPYQSPATGSPAPRRRIRIRLIPAAVFFTLGVLYVIGGAISLVVILGFILYDYEPVSLTMIAGRCVFFFAGASWMIAGRDWNRGTWSWAVVWSVVGYLAGATATHFAGFNTS